MLNFPKVVSMREDVFVWVQSSVYKTLKNLFFDFTCSLICVECHQVNSWCSYIFIAPFIFRLIMRLDVSQQDEMYLRVTAFQNYCNHMMSTMFMMPEFST